MTLGLPAWTPHSFDCLSALVDTVLSKEAKAIVLAAGHQGFPWYLTIRDSSTIAVLQFLRTFMDRYRDVDNRDDRQGVVINVLTLNCWGLWLVSKARKERLRLIAEYLRRSHHELVLLQEVWMTEDVELLTTITGFGHLKHWHHFKSGLFGSGLLVLSSFPFLQVGLLRFSALGNPLSLSGDFHAAKGVGWVRCRGPASKNGAAWHFDAFLTHLSAGSLACRLAQVWDIARYVRGIIDQGNRGGVVFAGDLNARPDSLEIRLLRHLLPDLLDAWPAAKPGQDGFTSNRQDNSFSAKGSGHQPQRIDYVWSTGQALDAQVLVQHAIGGMSYSDHCGVAASLRFPISGTADDCTGAPLTANFKGVRPGRAHQVPHQDDTNDQHGRNAWKQRSHPEPDPLLLHVADLVADGTKALKDQAKWTAALGIALWAGAVAVSGLLIAMPWADFPWLLFLVLQLALLPCAGVPPFLFTLGYIGSHDQARAFQEIASQLQFSAWASSQGPPDDKPPPPRLRTSRGG